MKPATWTGYALSLLLVEPDCGGQDSGDEGHEADRKNVHSILNNLLFVQKGSCTAVGRAVLEYRSAFLMIYVSLDCLYRIDSARGKNSAIWRPECREGGKHGIKSVAPRIIHNL
jgi:hypothetical protein